MFSPFLLMNGMIVIRRSSVLRGYALCWAATIQDGKTKEAETHCGCVTPIVQAAVMSTLQRSTDLLTEAEQFVTCLQKNTS
mmetsp:Transcript_38323/g.46224  ORF Transcript_38323/g.46224 Transcript_38323/m.46224 type:complete len:81 (-) Transcript_38323:184-426(-)